MIPNTGWRLNVNARFVHTFLIFLCFIHVSWILLSYVPICLKVECGSVWRDSCDVSAAVGPDDFIPVSWWERMSQLKGSFTEVGGVTLMSTAVKKKPTQSRQDVLYFSSQWKVILAAHTVIILKSMFLQILQLFVDSLSLLTLRDECCTSSSQQYTIQSERTCARKWFILNFWPWNKMYRRLH